MVVTHPDGIAPAWLPERSAHRGEAGRSRKRHHSVEKSPRPSGLKSITTLTSLAYSLACVKSFRSWCRQSPRKSSTPLPPITCVALSFAELHTCLILGDSSAAIWRNAGEEIDPADEVGWEQFVIDLATLEWTYSEVFDGSGVEKDPPYTPPIFRLRTGSWHTDDARAVLTAACVAVSRARFYKSARQDPETSPPGPNETFLAITRRDYAVRHVELSPPEYILRLRSDRGSSVGDAIALLNERDDIDDLEASSRAGFRKGSRGLLPLDYFSMHSTPASLLDRLRSADGEAWVRFVRLYTPFLYHWAGQRGVQSSDTARSGSGSVHTTPEGAAAFTYDPN